MSSIGATGVLEMPDYRSGFGWEYPTAAKPRKEEAVATSHGYYQMLGMTWYSRKIPDETVMQTEEVGGAQQSLTARKMHSVGK
jgi:hypothetical protein